ncbi:dolichol-phosphate mannosyltransferase [Falsiroseomonas bella]|uniref:Dolichol-phosphate mannosyltransferase n=1 Tax=Falsiroseomonas bella TaxID=2184016 RepID=A0A317FJJ9_9PROT|nr:glycosyltransferase family 2 protein [Falsiroseomonas bella]PWS38803.1 dolichol-phosphate mannosyltransferase [Falsiroseomonas bella]
MAPDLSPGPDRPASADPAPVVPRADAPVAIAEDSAASGTGAPPLLSVVIPMRNEAPNVLPLLEEIAAALDGTRYEVVCVDDGSTDETARRLAEATLRFPLVALRHAASCGQSAAVISGVRAARGAWIATLDGDGQNDPADIPRLWARARAEVAGGVPALVAGHRVSRKDSGVKRVTSRIANAIRARLLGDATPDTGCGLKVFPRALFLDLPRFDHMHRYLPALVLRQGARVVSEPVNHRPRLRGASNYGTLDRLIVSLSDLLGVIWLQRRWKRPAAEPIPPP